MPRIIFHLPMKIDKKHASASQIRPIKLIKAFKECGYEVDVVEGYGADRKKQIAVIKENIIKGIKYDFLYSESSTMPTLLTERNHLPIYPFLDFSFFTFCKRNKIKIGLFYRDIYWCFREGNKNWKQKVATFFYRYDLKKYKELVDVFFLPSMDMLKYIPFHFPHLVEELPSGLELNIHQQKHVKKSEINLLYIGGIGKHYGLKMIFEAVSNISNINFTICCRKDEWEKVEEEYKTYLSDNILIVHKSGKDVENLYRQTDLFCLFIEPMEYRSFAVPFKLFEAVGFGCPILSSEGTWVARFVKKNAIGFTCEYDVHAIKKLLIEIVNHQDELQVYKKRMEEIAIGNTWQARCNKVAALLTTNKC